MLCLADLFDKETRANVKSKENNMSAEKTHLK